MEGFGLPRTAEALLTTLLMEREVSSWKVAGDGDSTVFILHFGPGQKTTGQPPLRGAWRRKPPCAIERDRRRAELRRQTLQRTQPNNTNDSNSGNSGNNGNHDQEQVRDNTEIETIVDTRRTSEASAILLPLSNEIQNGTLQTTHCDSQLAIQDTQTSATREVARDAHELMEVGHACSSTSDIACKSAVFVNTTATCRSDNNADSDKRDSSATNEKTYLEQLAVVLE